MLTFPILTSRCIPALLWEFFQHSVCWSFVGNQEIKPLLLLQPPLPTSSRSGSYCPLLWRHVSMLAPLPSQGTSSLFILLIVVSPHICRRCSINVWSLMTDRSFSLRGSFYHILNSSTYLSLYQNFLFCSTYLTVYSCADAMHKIKVYNMFVSDRACTLLLYFFRGEGQWSVTKFSAWIYRSGIG